MKKIWLVLQKEMREILGQRTLLLTIASLPLLIVAVNAYMMVSPLINGRLPAVDSDPRLAGMTQAQIAQTVAAIQFRMLLLAQPLLIPSIIAAYSIVGEKNNRTLEPLLAAPVRTGQLLLAKSLSALLPALTVTWLSGAIFIAEVALLSSAAVMAAVVTPGWLVMLVVMVPIMMLIPIAVTVMISSRASDPRTASQTSTLIFMVFVAAFVLFTGPLVFSPVNALEITAVLLVVGIVLLRIATRLFQREVILTRWS
jgi:ABC-2 type transport system permease protein